ncbi:bifunctional diaminohydroxyphosphoribosylaminopyrimidine deaminase/5-amino-6-(5-phosphoribosylamino)uracil reductase RibD [Micromonospora humida]|uniref:bifunctional diaminohydroxyphosphoribosylaminopyrimidine deaminase/5-amino-6-(5-phosphoribosylamino)uracil reductase RibD n=1 Tax=Micromonospora humida TaxID=2809018 RepID=UPI00366A8D4A
MRHAITLSSFGLGTTSPNPPVGCVILDRHGAVVGVGYHRRKGEPHAEVHALRAAGAAARGGTAVVTLEPCNHVGVTPACRQALIDARIARVVVSVIDPTSRGDGGAAVLAAHGIDVEVDVIPDETLTVLGPWLVATHRRRPYLTWVYSSASKDSFAVSELLPNGLRRTADLVAGDDSIVEGVPGGHAPAYFTVPDVPTGDLRGWLATCYAAGTRSIMLKSAQRSGNLYNNFDYVDEVLTFVERLSPSGNHGAATWPSHLGFELIDIASEGGGVWVRLRRPISIHSPAARLPERSR